MRILLLITAGLVCAAGAENRHPSQVAGIYEGAIPVKGSDARKLTLTLKQDGSAEFRDAGKRAMGEWEVNGQTLHVILKEAALDWRVKGNLLAPRIWDSGIYGKKGPVLRRPR